MKGKILTSKGNIDGTISVKFAKGLDRKALIDMEEKEIELDYPTDRTNLTLPEVSKIIAPIIRTLDDIARPFGVEVYFREIENAPALIQEGEKL